ncbi:MAG TPA: hypothetical protein VMA13_04685 [Candidatus Saccharimonadales bacterium]|nr:hypothetical protein [Candidatus Saccharimonadales bacterium]
MSKLRWKYVFLAMSLAAFAAAAMDQQPTIFSFMTMPAGAIFFGLFMIATVLEKESALYDEQTLPTQRKRPHRPDQTTASRPSSAFTAVHSP